MSRDPEFTADFLKRHQNKLLFGSDCACSDGHGGGVSQNNNPAAARMAGKCVARETLSAAEAVRLTGRLPEDRLGQRPQAAADSGLAAQAGSLSCSAIVPTPSIDPSSRSPGFTGPTPSGVPV